MKRIVPIEQIAPRWLSTNDVIELTRFARSTIYKWIAEKKFPDSFDVLGGAKRWRATDVIEWMRREDGSAQEEQDADSPRESRCA